MRLLLDTQVFLWVLSNSSRIGRQARAWIETADEVYVSAASIWEAAIKMRIGKLEVLVDDLLQAIEPSGFMELPVSARHAARVASLPLIHRDPFDRLLVAQALETSLQLLTADPQLTSYSDLVTLID
jgi:PIN domain nuclease of toxin-antitoxin system